MRTRADKDPSGSLVGFGRLIVAGGHEGVDR